MLIGLTNALWVVTDLAKSEQFSNTQFAIQTRTRLNRTIEIKLNINYEFPNLYLDHDHRSRCIK